jgi:hypothetical protein
MARPSKQQNIEPWLKGLLGAGRRKAEDVIAAAEAAGIKERTLRRVKAELRVISEKADDIWYWRDPAVAEPKAVSEDKLDLIAHKVDEAIRLAKPAVPVSAKSDSILPKLKPYDSNDPKNVAIRLRLQRHVDMEEIITSADPFHLLDSADLEEIGQMKNLVRNHLSELQDRSRKPKFKKAWRVTKKFEKQVIGREWSAKKGEWIEVPATQIEEETHISDVPIDGAELVSLPDGYEPGEDESLETGKWETWIDRAREREKQLRANAKIAA